MNERYQEVLAQYEMEVLSVRKGRGSWICETDKGLKLLREYRGTVRRLEFEDQVLESIDNLAQNLKMFQNCLTTPHYSPTGKAMWSSRCVWPWRSALRSDHRHLLADSPNP